jgi:hypothetical protein
MSSLDNSDEHDDSDDGPYFKELSHDEVYMIHMLRSENISKTQAKISLLRRVGLNPSVTITNTSGHNAWVILSPAPILSVSSVGVEKIGQISFSSSGEYKCQQSSIANYSSREFDLDNSEIYYTVFFNCSGKWKTPFKNRKINTRKYNINLLGRHVEESIDCDFVPSG